MNFKLESGVQLLARLHKKQGISGFLPDMFGNGPHPLEVIELAGESGAGKSMLLTEFISTALLPAELNGRQTDVLIFLTDGKFDFNILSMCIQQRLIDSVVKEKKKEQLIKKQLEECFQRLHIVEIFDSKQYCLTIQNLDSIFLEHPNISMLVFDTLCAFYWSDQDEKLMKMETYLKNIIKLISKSSMHYKPVIFYTKPQHFSSKCPAPAEVTYSIKLEHTDGEYQAKLANKTFKFSIRDNCVKWL